MRPRLVVLLLLVPGLAMSACGRGAGHRPPGSRGPVIAPSGALNAGGEPQWSAQVRGDQLRFSTGEASAVRVQASIADHGKTGATWSGSLASAPNQPAGLLRLTVVAKACVDAPTGMTYPFAATVEMAGQSYVGCAALAGQGLGPRT